jgi:hypothetical protein
MSMLPDDPESTILKRLKRPRPEDPEAPNAEPGRRSSLAPDTAGKLAASQ